MTSETITAWATLALAVGTVLLAYFTYRLARAANGTERAEWRPVLIPATDRIEEQGDGEFRIKLKNVGRGPALGVQGELRIGGPSGGTKPGEPSICEAEEEIDLFFLVRGDPPPGSVRQMEITYYDIAEWWHGTELIGFPQRAEDGGGFRIAARMSTGELGRKANFVESTARGKNKRLANRIRNGLRLRRYRWSRRVKGRRPKS